MAILFQKMHGLGNDFVIIDERRVPMQLVSEQQRVAEVRAIADRKRGVGCDQLIVMRPSRHGDLYMQIYNADGSQVAACGNATRCVGWLVMREERKETVLIETESGILSCHLEGKGLVSVNMGRPKLAWDEVPLSEKLDTRQVMVPGMAETGVCVSVGNPHIVFFVDQVSAVPLAQIGPEIETHPLFPERVNVNLAQVDSREHLTLRTWERGAGETLACGTGACATMVAARRRGLVDERVTVTQPGGDLTIAWKGSEDDPEHDVYMTGEVTQVFSGEMKDGMWV